MKMLSRALTVLFAILFAAAARAAAGVAVHDPWIREAPPNATALAGYMVLENRTGAAVALVGAASEAFNEVMLHRTQVRGGVAEMVHQHRIEIGPGAGLTFKPGGYHLMLMGPKNPLRAGDQVSIELRFGDGTTLPVRFTVRQGGGGGGSHTRH